MLASFLGTAHTRRSDVEQFQCHPDHWASLVNELDPKTTTTIKRDDDSEIVTGRVDHEPDLIFLGWRGPLEDCNFFYIDSTESEKLQSALARLRKDLNHE